MSAPLAPLETVEWRVDSEPYDRNGTTTCRFVPYLNAPIVAGLLDEWVGPDGWSDEYVVGQLGGKEVLWCRLTIGEITKVDVGMPSNTEPQKGQVSDAFKRAACLKWGVGRNVYDLPTLFAKCGTRQRGDKRIAFANKDTLPDLLRQLKALGYDASGGRVEDAPEGVDAQTGEIAGDGGEPGSEPGTGDHPPAASPSVSLLDVPDEDVKHMTIKELHDELERRGLPSSGTKAEMMERLVAA